MDDLQRLERELGAAMAIRDHYKKDFEDSLRHLQLIKNSEKLAATKAKVLPNDPKAQKFHEDIVKVVRNRERDVKDARRTLKKAQDKVDRAQKNIKNYKRRKK